MKKEVGLINRTRRLQTAAALALFAPFLLAGTAFAQTQTATPPTGSAGWGKGSGGQQMHRAPGVFGTVASVNGNMLTVTSKGFGKSTTTATTTYTVDASGATVMKNNATSSISSIATGDTVMIQGTVNGTSVTATMIRDGVMGMGMMGKGPGGQGKPVAPNSIIKGNGEPVIGGTVASVSGTSLSITNTSNVTYAVDASSAVVEKGNATSSVSAIATGDRVVVQGSVSGTNVTATSIMDQGAAPSTTGSGSDSHTMGMGGFLGSIGGFFQHLFGFF